MRPCQPEPPGRRRSRRGHVGPVAQHHHKTLLIGQATDDADQLVASRDVRVQVDRRMLVDQGCLTSVLAQAVEGLVHRDPVEPRPEWPRHIKPRQIPERPLCRGLGGVVGGGPVTEHRIGRAPRPRPVPLGEHRARVCGAREVPPCKVAVTQTLESRWPSHCSHYTRATTKTPSIDPNAVAAPKVRPSASRCHRRSDGSDPSRRDLCVSDLAFS